MEKKKKTLIEDFLGEAVPVVIPTIAEKLLEFVPEGSKVDDFLRNYHKYWGKAFGAINMIVKHFTNAPEIVDSVLSELSAETARVILKRYSADGVITHPNKNAGISESYSFVNLMAYLSSTNLIAMNEKLALLPTSQKNICLRYVVVARLEVAKKFVANLSRLTNDQFIAWAGIACPEPKPREKTALEKGVGQGWTDFTKDLEAAATKGGFFSNLAKKKGLI